MAGSASEKLRNGEDATEVARELWEAGRSSVEGAYGQVRSGAWTEAFGGTDMGRQQTRSDTVTRAAKGPTALWVCGGVGFGVES